MAADKPSMDTIVCAAIELRSDDERAAYISAAEMMPSAPVGGRGQPFRSGCRSRRVLREGRRRPLTRAAGAAMFHNVYWLVAGETGYPGVIAFAVLPINSLFVAFSSGWRFRGDQKGDLLLGIGAGY